MSRLVGFSMPLPRLADVQVQGGKHASADIISTLGGRSRWLNELMGFTAEDETPCAPFTGMGGKAGHDHSGVVSVPLLHTLHLWQYGGVTPLPTGIVNGIAPACAVNAGDPEVLLFRTRFFHVFVPNCGPAGAYSSMALDAQVQSDQIVNVEVRVNAAGGQCVWNDDIPANQLTSVISHRGDQMIPLMPGHYNSFTLDVTITRKAADATVSLIAIGLHQVRTTTRLLP